PHSHSRWGARGYDIAWLEHHELADVGNQRCAVENHRPGVAGLHALAVHVEPHVEVLHICDLIPCDQPRTDGPKGIAALALVPTAPSLVLEVSLGKIVADHITGDVIESGAPVDVRGALANNEAELHLPIHLY